MEPCTYLNIWLFLNPKENPLSSGILQLHHEKGVHHTPQLSRCITERKEIVRCSHASAASERPNLWESAEPNHGERARDGGQGNPGRGSSSERSFRRGCMTSAFRSGRCPAGAWPSIWYATRSRSSTRSNRHSSSTLSRSRQGLCRGHARV